MTTSHITVTTDDNLVEVDPEQADSLDVPFSRDVEHFHETVAEAIAKSRYTAWNDIAGSQSWDEFSADPKRADEVAVYREDGARDAGQVLADLIASEVIAVLVLPAAYADGSWGRA